MKRQTRTTGRQKIRRYRSLNLGDATTANGPIEIETRQPNRKPDTQADVAVPAAQALISATIAALLAGMLALLAGRNDVPRIMGGSFVIVLAIAWLWRLGVSDRLLEVIERITQTDIDKNGDIGSVGDTGHVMVMQPNEARQTAGKKERSRDRAMRLADLIQFVNRCATVGCSEREQGIKPGTDARTAYQQKRDLLISLGVARWRNPDRLQAGWVLAVSEQEAIEILRHHVMDVSG